MTVICAACCNPDVSVFTLGKARRARCRECQHEQRVDIETFDYAGFAMGATGGSEARLADQTEFLVRHLSPGLRILECGCATGGLAASLRTRLAISAYHGIELSPARDIAASTIDHLYDAPLPELLRHDRIKAASYGAVITSHCLEHIKDINTEIAGIHTALTHDGTLFIEVPNRSGHPGLPYDDNRSHLHFFSASSLTRLLGRHQLEITALETGAWHDARYPDCIRVIAQRVGPLPATRHTLSDHPLLRAIDRLIVWGAGRMADEILAHYFDPARIIFFVDKDHRKHGTQCLGRPVQPLEDLRKHPGCTILINSLEYGDTIKTQIDGAFSDVHANIITMSDVLGELQAEQ